MAKTPEQRRAYYLAHAPEFKRKQAAYDAANPDRVKSNQLLQNYGITLATYEAMLAAQGGVCAICLSNKPGFSGKNKAGRRSNRYFCVDHDHETGAVRGLLCSTCNRMLGMAEDNLEILAAAYHYVASSRRR